MSVRIGCVGSMMAAVCAVLATPDLVSGQDDVDSHPNSGMSAANPDSPYGDPYATSETVDTNTDYAFRHLLLDLSLAPSPKVHERSTNPAGASTTYDHHGIRSHGYELAVMGLMGTSRDNQGGYVYGAGLSAATYNVTPSSYTVGGASYPNTSGTQLSYRTFAVDLLGGYQIGISNTDEFDAFVELTPLVGGGIGIVQDQIHVNNQYVTKTGYGPYGEFGARLGFGFTQNRWIVGIHGSLVDRIASIKITFPGGYASTVSLHRVGLGAGITVGYRL